MAVTQLNPPTLNFQISYDPTLPNALANAIQLSRTIEADFQTLTNWFGIADGFGPDNRVNVNLVYSGNSGSDNQGYHGDGSTTLNLNGAPNVGPIDGVIRMHFIAEFSEVLMDYNNQHGPTTWVAGYSHGEGLSQYCAYLIAPTGYTAFYGPVFENAWLTSSRVSNNWVDNTEQTDKDQLSFGCALLFLFYLHSQRNYGTATIIRNGADTLAQTYTKLTGQTDGFSSFRGLLDRFYPPGQRDARLDVVNPFPLIEGAGRRVDFDVTGNLLGSPVLVHSGHKLTKAFFTCPEKDYSYNIWGQPYQMIVTAKTYGFAYAGFNWYVNGLVFTGYSGTESVPIKLSTIDLDAPTGVVDVTTNISLSWQITAKDNRTCTMVFTVGAPYGKYELDIRVDATEVYNNLPTVSGTDVEMQNDSRLRWEDQYYTDQQACEAPFLRIARDYVRYHRYLSLLLVAPDPPPDIERAVGIVKNLASQVKTLDQAPAEVRRGIDVLLQQKLGISAGQLRSLAGGESGEEKVMEAAE